MRIITALVLVDILSACSVLPDASLDDVQSNQNVEGDSTQETQVDDVFVDDANVNADTDVSSNIDANLTVNIGDVTDDEVETDDSPGTTTVLGTDVAFEYAYQGPIDERVDAVPSAPDLAVDSVEWIVRGPVFDEPTLLDDADGFDWGAPQVDDLNDDLDEYVITARFDTDALAPLAWTPESGLCDDGLCDGRAVSAVCSGQLVLRVWLTDGSTREASANHESARPTCW